MIDLKQFEVWFVTGNQQLYGEETLCRVAGDSPVPRPRRRGAGPGPRRAGRVDHAGSDSAALPRSHRNEPLHRHGGVDAHLLAGQDVDRGP